MDSGARDLSARPVVVAAFDVDKTLTTRDCVIPFLRRVGGSAFVLRLLGRGPQLVLAIARRRRDHVKSIATRAAVRGKAVAIVDDQAHRFAEDVWSTRMRPDTVSRLRWHLDRDHRVVLVSASFRNYLEPLARRLGAHAVLATELAVENGVCTGELLGPNCRAEVKAERLRGWVREQGFTDVEIWAYGDSAGDRQLLALADHATLVGHDLVPSSPEVAA